MKRMNIKHCYADPVQHVMKLKNITISQLSEKSGIKENILRDYFSGAQYGINPNWLKIMQTLDVSPLEHLIINPSYVIRGCDIDLREYGPEEPVILHYTNLHNILYFHNYELRGKTARAVTYNDYQTLHTTLKDANKIFHFQAIDYRDKYPMI